MVDDNEDAANTLAMILKMEGHEVDTAYSGAQALERIDEFQPAVVLLDIGLPGIDGYEVARRIRATARRARTFNWSRSRAMARTPTGCATRDAGFAHHLVKPVDFADLQRLLAQIALTGRLPACARRIPLTRRAARSHVPVAATAQGVSAWRDLMSIVAGSSRNPDC